MSRVALDSVCITLCIARIFSHRLRAEGSTTRDAVFLSAMSTENMAASTEVYCCGKPYDPTQFMIQCDGCKEWFHGR